MASIKARLKSVEEQLYSPVKVDIFEALKRRRRTLERRFALRHNNQWNELEAELLAEVKGGLNSAKEAFKWLKKNDSKDIDWRNKRFREGTFYSLARSIDELVDCRNQSVHRTQEKDRGDVYTGGFKVWESIMQEAEDILSK